MGKIFKLPENLIRLIAAGEVIERPASVLKELVENSIDAGATAIDVDLWGAGRTRIRVTDNGEGMTPEDADQALERHATSKLRSFDDLQSLNTFGFRGEALPSIAAISRFSLTTRTLNAPHAWKIELEGGKEIGRGPAGNPPGTTIDVQDLFFNTPVRAKFIKRDSTERVHLLRTLQEQALAHPQVRFQVRVDDKVVISTRGADHLLGRLTELWGKSITDQLVPLEFRQGPVAVRGYVNAVPGHHSTKVYQHLFVNQRCVLQRALTHAIYEAFHEWLPVGRHPVYALFIDIDPNEVDVNVHPTKREVRFANERAVYDMLFSKIRSLFETRHDVPVVRDGYPGATTAQRFAPTLPSQADVQTLMEAMSPLTMGPSMVREPSMTSDFAPAATRLNPVEIRYLGQFHRLYLLAEQGSDLLLIDQHAAAERILYERFLANASRPVPGSQPLLHPYLYEATPDQASLLRDALPGLRQIGFDVEALSANAFALREWPAGFPDLREAKLFLELFVASLENERPLKEGEIHHEAVASAACRAAIKANDGLATTEVHHLVKELAACERPMTCPHGRPTHIRLPLSELHHRFRRT